VNPRLGPGFNPSYVGPRDDILGLVPPVARRVLEVGCSVGVLGEAIKAKTGAYVVGVELSEEMAAHAEGRLDRVIRGDIETLLEAGAFRGERFDVIVAADVLEHLRDPWGALAALATLAEPGGAVVASLPNVRHLDTIFHLLVKGTWPHRERGIHDRTHLRFFTRRDAMALFHGAGLEVERVDVHYRLREAPHRVNRHAKWLALPGLREFLAFQYLVRARRRPVID
jgi:2-polyprenyl-3-methyl-5-hydroxy-6-metoxy-1,4-benzoquinol methylase